MPRVERRSGWPPPDLTRRFAEVARALQGAGTSQKTLQALVDLATSTIPGCEHAGVSMVTPDSIETSAASSDVPREVDRIQYRARQGPCLDAIRHHEIYITDDLATETRWPDFSARTAAETGVHSMLSFRLFVEEDTLGSLNLYSEVVGAFGAESRSTGAVFAAHAAVAVATSREHDRAVQLEVDLTSSEEDVAAYQRQAQAALTFQRSMLPTLPVADGYALAARYVPAHESAQVGGDWYDAFRLPGGDMALVVGDVAGHDMAAAVQMSQLRSLLRGIAVDRAEEPGHVLRRLDRVATQLQVSSTATCVYGVLEGDPASGWNWRYANAGHPPALLITDDGSSRFLEGEGDHLLLGLDIDLPRGSAIRSVPPGATLLLYTDGLIERRGQDLADGLEDLRGFTASLAAEPVELLLDRLIARFATAPEDDVCLLALRVSSGRPQSP